MIEPVGRSLENRQFATYRFAGVLWWRSANVARSSPGLTVIGIQPDGGGQEVGGGTVALGVGAVGVDCTSGWGVGV